MLERLVRRVTRTRACVARGPERTSDDDNATKRRSVFLSGIPRTQWIQHRMAKEGFWHLQQENVFWWPIHSQCEHQILPNAKCASASEGPLPLPLPNQFEEA